MLYIFINQIFVQIHTIYENRRYGLAEQCKIIIFRHFGHEVYIVRMGIGKTQNH